MAPTQGLAVGVRLPAKLALLVDSPKHINAIENDMAMPPLGVAWMLISDMLRMQLDLGKSVYSRHATAFIQSTQAANSGIVVFPEVEELVRSQLRGDPRRRCAVGCISEGQ